MTGTVTEVVLKVSGMTCTGCEASVVRSVRALGGVEAVEADHLTGRVRVAGGAGVTREAIAARIEAAGFEVKE